MKAILAILVVVLLGIGLGFGIASWRVNSSPWTSAGVVVKE